MNNKILKIQSHLHVCGTSEADNSAAQDLNVPDPEPEKAKAILDEAMGKEIDDEDIEAIDEGS